VFLDRDGTLIKDVHYLKSFKKIEILPGVIEGLRLLKKRSYEFVVVTNQSGVGRGYMPEKSLKKIHQRLKNLFRKKGIKFLAIYYSPYYENSKRKKYRLFPETRKPSPFFIKKACKEFLISPHLSTMIGDKPTDMECGKAAGMRTIFLDLQETKGFLEAAKKINL